MKIPRSIYYHFDSMRETACGDGWIASGKKCRKLGSHATGQRVQRDVYGRAIDAPLKDVYGRIQKKKIKR